YAELMARDFYAETDYPVSYLQITLTDEEDIPDALMRLRTVYPYLLRLEYDNIRTRTDTALQALDEAAKVDPFTMTAAFYEQQNGQEMTAEMTEFLNTLIASVWEGGEAK
ncbi:MAG: exonuclease SbcCD subunit D C-terminal domain-containing protein, partial [Clostridia bacterium]|nr:exonuclease SbcCD subunit D C-terminal domain-containing protein [Clostridia bacterium]